VCDLFRKMCAWELAKGAQDICVLTSCVHYFLSYMMTQITSVAMLKKWSYYFCHILEEPSRNVVDVAEQISVCDIISVFSLILGFNLTELSCWGLMCEVTLFLQSLEKLRRCFRLPVDMDFWMSLVIWIPYLSPHGFQHKS